MTRNLTLDFLHKGTTEASVELAFSAPISLEDASIVALDTVVAEITSTSSVQQSFALVTELLSDGEPVAALSTMSGSQSGSITTKRNFPPRNDSSIPDGVMIDGLRLTSTLSDTSMSVRYRGAYAGNVIRVRVARGTLGSGQCHKFALVPAAMPVVVIGAGSSNWVTQPFSTPIPAADLHFALVQHPGFTISSATIDSFDIQGQLLLDNNAALQMQNWSSPGASGPPSEMRVWGCVTRLTVDYPACADLTNREIIGWRWRVHKTGDGLLTVTQIDPTKIWFLRDSCSPAGTVGDLNGDGIVDGADLAALLSNWGPCVDCNDCPADFDDNCIVDGADFATLLSNWS